MKNILVLLLALSLTLFSGCGGNDAPPAVTFEEQLAIDIEIIDDYLSDNEINAEIHESGIRYVIRDQGSGETPEVGSEVMVRYESFLVDGTAVGADTIGFSLMLEEPIISAWLLMVPTIEEGGKIDIYSPSGYLFGTQGNGSGIGPNTIIFYEIEVIAVVNDDEERFTLEGEIIDEFLTESDISFETHSSGIRYTVITEGTGDSPDPNNSVLVVYEGSLLTGAVFDRSDVGRTFNISGLINAWQIMLPTMKEGGKIKFYAPSKFCYGTSGNDLISPNTVLTFEIELVDIIN